MLRLASACLSTILALYFAPHFAPQAFAAQTLATVSTHAATTTDVPSDAELRAIEQATAGAVLAEVALRCHWQTDEAFIAKAKGTALVIAVADVAPTSRQLALMVQILESPRMTHHRDVARDQLAAGACTQAQTRALWSDLEHLTLDNAGAGIRQPPVSDL
ncbi:hypothetical protein BH11PSE14_BH11PSE14_05000 [soil metagenome]